MLSWLLGEPRGETVREALADAELVLSSTLTLVECDRALLRAKAVGDLDEEQWRDRHELLERAAVHWILFDLDAAIVERARRPFPLEPIRSLDALHVASAELARTLVPELLVLSLDERVRGVASLLGLPLHPA